MCGRSLLAHYPLLIINLFGLIAMCYVAPPINLSFDAPFFCSRLYELPVFSGVVGFLLGSVGCVLAVLGVAVKRSTVVVGWLAVEGETTSPVASSRLWNVLCIGRMVLAFNHYFSWLVNIFRSFIIVQVILWVSVPIPITGLPWGLIRC